MYTAWIILGIGTIFAEVILWMFFERKLRGLHFSRSLDESFFRFFSPIRLRIVAALHSLCLFTVFILLSVFLW